MWRSQNLLIPGPTPLQTRKKNPGGNSSKHRIIIPISKQRRANIRNSKGTLDKPPRKSNPNQSPKWDAPTETPRTSCAGTRPQCTTRGCRSRRSSMPRRRCRGIRGTRVMRSGMRGI